MMARNESTGDMTRWMIPGIYAAAVIVLIGTALVSIVMDRPIYVFTRDPAALVDISPFYGLVSNLGILLWFGGAVISLFSALLLWRRDRSLQVIGFLIISGLFSMVLMLDDLFMLHEHVVPKFLRIPQRAVIAIYPILAVLYLLRYRELILRTNYWFLILGFGFLAVSVGSDLIPPFLADWHPLFEDGAKFLGIVSWFIYLANLCYLEIGRILTPVKEFVEG